MLSAHFFRFLTKNFKKHGQVGVIFYGLRKFPGTKKLGLVIFWSSWAKNLKKWADNTEVLWIPQLLIPQTWKLVHNSRLQMFRTTFMDLKNFPKNFPRDHTKTVSSTVQWSSLVFSDDDLTEELSAAQQLKDAVLKTLIFRSSKKAHQFDFCREQSEWPYI